MRRLGAVVLGVLLASAALLAVAGSVRAQGDAADKLFLTSEDAASPLGGSADCGTLGAPGYTMNETLDTPETSEKAYTAASAGAIACATNFHYEASVDAALVGEAIVHLFVSCDSAAVFAPGTDPVASSQLRVDLRKNGEMLASTNASPFPEQCAMGDVLEANVSLGSLQTGLPAGGTLDLQLLFFASNTLPAQENLHILVDSTDHPSALIAAGLPGAPRSNQPSGNQTNTTNTTGDEANDSPGFGALGALSAVGLALLAARARSTNRA